MYAELVAEKVDGIEPTGGDCWVFGYFPDPGSPGGICFAGFMPGI
jgi:hypothetical protein